MSAQTPSKNVGSHLSGPATFLLGVYFLAVPSVTLWFLYHLYPVGSVDPEPERNRLLLAMVGGALGSYLHSAQSFAAYVGNRQARSSWIWWYILRVPIGASLGVLMVIVMMAGLIGQQSPEPAGVVAFAALAGWFSKQATDKLAEVFETLFRSEKSAHLANPLKATPAPTIVVAVPENGKLVVRGEDFEQGAEIRVDGKAVTTTFVSDKELTADALPPGAHTIVVANPAPNSTPSDPHEIEWPAAV